MSPPSLPNVEEIHWKELEIEHHHSDVLVRLFQTCIACLLDQICACAFFARPWGSHLVLLWIMWIAAILDLWRHFRPPSWICDVTSGRHLGFPVTWLPVILWSRDFRLGSHVTGNPRWRPEVTSQIQDGGRKWRHKSKMAAIHIIHSRTKWFP